VTLRFERAAGCYSHCHDDERIDVYEPNIGHRISISGRISVLYATVYMTRYILDAKSTSFETAREGGEADSTMRCRYNLCRGWAPRLRHLPRMRYRTYDPSRNIPATLTLWCAGTSRHIDAQTIRL